MSQTSETQFLENGLDPRAFLARAGDGKTIERYAKNQKIFSQGEVAGTVFFIQKGKVKLTVLSELGKEAAAGIFAEGQIFGEGSLPRGAITGAPHPPPGDRPHPPHPQKTQPSAPPP